jgi:hypothetical protein
VKSATSGTDEQTMQHRDRDHLAHCLAWQDPSLPSRAGAYGT